MSPKGVAAGGGHELVTRADLQAEIKSGRVIAEQWDRMGQFYVYGAFPGGHATASAALQRPWSHVHRRWWGCGSRRRPAPLASSA